MAVRQYIGARYVIKVYENSLDPSSAEWEASITYEPLTMVTYNYSSYLSKKEVPGSVGDPASNPQYWVETGSYNGQIATLQAQIDNLKSAFYIFEPTGDTSDRSADLTTALSTRKAIMFTEGDYYFSSTVTIPDDSLILGTGLNTRLILSTGATGAIFDPGNNVTISDITFDGGLTAKPANHNGNRHGIHAHNKEWPIRINSCNFVGFSGYGIRVTDMGYGHLSSIQVSNSYFRYNGAGVNYEEHGEYGLITSSHFIDNFVGALVRGGNNIFNDCSMSRNSYGGYVDGDGIANSGHGVFNGCTFNHNTAIGLHFNDLVFGYNVTGCMIFLNTTFDLEVTTCVGGMAINSNNFGNAAKINIGTSNIVFRDNIFQTAPTITFDVASKIYGNSNMVSDGSTVATINNIIPFNNILLTKTYESQSCVAEAGFNVAALKQGGSLLLTGTITVVTAATAYTKIGHINVPSNLYGNYLFNISTESGTMLAIELKADGDLSIYGPTATGTFKFNNIAFFA